MCRINTRDQDSCAVWITVALIWMVLSNPLSAQDSVCARVTLQINQEAVLTRTVFKATLNINNNAATPLTGLTVILDIRNSDGQIAGTLFDGQNPQEAALAGITGGAAGHGDLIGGGTIAPGATGSAVWTIFPTDLAAPTTGTHRYTVGGQMQYVLDGLLTTVPLYPAPIDVLPDAKLFLNYYLQSQVYSDNPFTTPIEPSEPFNLGLLVRNEGLGEARDLKITSSQPKIIRNDNHLAVAFNITGTQVNTQQVAPSLAVAFGDVPPSGSAVARWFMTSTIQGYFICYSATFEHVNPLNNPALSLIAAVKIYELNHMIQLTGPGQDNLPDFLVNNRQTPPVVDACNSTLLPACTNCDQNDTDRPNLGPCNDYIPDCVHSSDGNIQAIHAVLSATTDGPPSKQNLVVMLTANVTQTGLNYIRAVDPSGDGTQFYLMMVERTGQRGGVPISTGGPGDVCNAWTTHRMVDADGTIAHPPFHPEDFVHIVDNLDAPGTYTYMLTYARPLRIEEIPRVNYPLSQRSNITDVTTDFSIANNLPDLISNGQIVQAVTLWRRAFGTGDATPVTLTANRFSWDATNLRLTLDLTADGPGPSRRTMLTAGNYELRFDTSRIIATVNGLHMMDTDGLPDGIYRFGAVAVDYFYRFAGDTDGNRTINEMDELRVQSSWLKHAGQPGFDANADLNSDGVVNFLDLQLVRSNWMRTLGF